MRIGIVVDSACDLPREFIDQHAIQIMPITLRIGDVFVEDWRDPVETQKFYAWRLDQGHADYAESIPYSPEQIETLFLERLVLEYDYVFCLTISGMRSPIFMHAQQAARSVLGKYREIRRSAGCNDAFGLAVLSTRNLFTGQAVPAAEAARLIAQGCPPSVIGEQLTQLIEHTHTYLVPADLHHIYKRASKKGDNSLGWGAYTLGSLLDVKPLLHYNCDTTHTVGKVRGFSSGAEQLFNRAAEQIEQGLDAPWICISYGGPLETVRDLKGYGRLERTAIEHDVTIQLAPMSKTAAINVGPGALSLAFAAASHRIQ